MHAYEHNQYRKIVQNIQDDVAGTNFKEIVLINAKNQHLFLQVKKSISLNRVWIKKLDKTFCVYVRGDLYPQPGEPD